MFYPTSTSVFPTAEIETQAALELSLKFEILSEIEQLPISDESSQRIYLVRHGESTANVYFKNVSLVSGQSKDIPLTETGNEQILELAKKLAERFQKQARLVITSSTAVRTQQTAKILYEELSKTRSNVTLIEKGYQGLNERYLGDWEGKLRDEKYVEAEAPWRAMSAEEKFVSPEVAKGESYSKVANRALLDLANIYSRYSDSTVIAVTSFNTINATAIKINKIDVRLSTAPGTNLPKLSLDYGDLVLIEIPQNQSIENARIISHIKNEK